MPSDREREDMFRCMSLAGDPALNPGWVDASKPILSTLDQYVDHYNENPDHLDDRHNLKWFMLHAAAVLR